MELSELVHNLVHQGSKPVPWVDLNIEWDDDRRPFDHPDEARVTFLAPWNDPTVQEYLERCRIEDRPIDIVAGW